MYSDPVMCTCTCMWSPIYIHAMQTKGDPSVNIVNRCQLHIPVGFSRVVAYLYVGVHLMHVLVVVISLTVRLEMFM